jgi:ribosomal protein L11 methyltransferase
MDYQELTFTVTSSEDYHQDLLIDALAQIGFDSFEEMDTGFKAYVPSSEFSQDVLNQALSPFEELFSFSYRTKFIPQTNWNEVWESNFQPIQIADTCYVRATFHDAHPEYRYEIVIDPKMAFGTGHHQTTASMMELMLEHNFNEKSVLDMGCGTGILAILASKLGARQVVAIDNDEVCIASTIENSKLNQIDNIIARCGSKEVIPEERFDMILANINRNVLLDQIDAYAKALSSDGVLFLSGFYEGRDLNMLIEKANMVGLAYITHRELDSWVAAEFAKIK